MHRRILVLRPHEWLQDAAHRRSFSTAAKPLHDRIAVRGMTFDERYAPVQVSGRLGKSDQFPRATGFNYGDRRPMVSFAIRSEFESEEAEARLVHEHEDDVVGIYADPAVSVFPRAYCGNTGVGTAQDVANKLGVPALREASCTGRGARVAIVDTGIDGSIVQVAGGWSPDPQYTPGTAAPDHGTMVAWDVSIAAPDATFYDYALLRSGGGTWTAFLSDAIAAYADLLALLAREPGPLVVNNSWGMYDRNEDEPVGSASNYSANPDHPFNQVVGALIAEGADVFFAAGNCGANCPDGRCGAHDIGPGASIHGANSHPDVITVAAVTTTGRWLGYSSQGPGGLYSRKPDLAAYSHFTGSGIDPIDAGTSAASPVAAGVAAALRQRFGRRRCPPASLKGVLQQSARPMGGSPGWNFDVGYGVIDAERALAALLPTRRAATRRRPARKRKKTATRKRARTAKRKSTKAVKGKRLKTGRKRSKTVKRPRAKSVTRKRAKRTRSRN